MNIVASSIFQCVQFPHQGKIVSIDQLYYCTPEGRTQMTNNIPFLGDSKITYESVGVGLLKDSFLMGTFPTLLPPTTQYISMFNMISTMAHRSFESSDPWIILSPLEFDTVGGTMPLSHAKAEYDTIQSTSPSPDDQHMLVSMNYSLPSWLDSLSSTFDYILHIFPSDESIMEILSIEEIPWDENHHHSSFLPHLDDIEKDISSIFPINIIDSPQTPILTQDIICHTPTTATNIFFFFVFSLRDRIPEFLWGLAQTIPSLILLHVTTSVNILSIFLLQGTLVPSIPETRKPGIIQIYGPDR
jgi:hypothetical protein